MNKYYEEFLNPTNEYRGKPFWAWNGKLEKEELLRQIHVMKGMGFGGFFMHSRTGLKTEYLGEEWFELVRVCTEEAEKLGMEPWIYDEDRWPSGSAGGIVTKNPLFRRKYLTLFMGKQPYLTENTVALFVGVVQENLILSGYRKISIDEAQQISLKDEEVFLSFYWRTMKNQSVFNGYTDLDRLNLEATREFIKVTHEQYKQKCGNSFNKLRGVFTDEPTYGPVFSDYGDNGKEQSWSVPWTYDLFEQFFERFGYDLIEKLPELFLINQGSFVSKIKWEYMELIEELFIERFLKPIQEWSHENNMLTTGHFVDENSLVSQAVPLGSMLRCYGYLDNPGMDCLTDNRYIPWAVKVLESAARQNGQRWKLSELYGATGWQMRFQDYKYVGDWQTVLGVNVRCQHLSWYTMEGEAKRDYPGTFLHQATWFKEHYYLENYFARLGYLISQGEPDCTTMVLHPIESVWAQIHVDWVEVLDGKSALLKNMEKKFKQLYKWLSETGVDFDYGDEGVLAERATVIEDSTGVKLQVGNMQYTRVIVSGSFTIRETTYRLLEEFGDKGGEILFIGSTPEYVSCEKSDRCKMLAKKSNKIPFNRKDVLRYFEQIPVKIRILDEAARKELYVQVRSCENEEFVFLYNKNRNRDIQNVRIHIPNEKKVELWDCFSGERYHIAKEREEIVLTFLPGQEYVLCLCAETDTSLQAYKTEETFGECEKLTQVLCYELDEKNVFVLDKADLWLNDQVLAEQEEILHVDRVLRKKLGIELRGGEMLQPWAVKDSVEALGRIRLSYHFQIEKLPQEKVYLALETMENMEIVLNGKKESLQPTDLFWVDTCFKVYEVSSDVLKAGNNELELFADYMAMGGLEAMYLIGDFGVFSRHGEMVIDALPKKIKIGDLTKQGFPFYGGKITYYFELPDIVAETAISVSVPKFGGSCIVAETGKKQQMLPWTWREATWQRCDKELAVTVVTFRRNTFGPLHQFPIKQPYTAPDSFECIDKNRYGVFPIGLLNAVEVRRREL